MSFSLSDFQILLDSRLTDLKDIFVQRMDSLDNRLAKVEEHVQTSAGDRAIIGLLERRVSALEEAAKANSSIATIIGILKWIGGTGGAVLLVHYVTKLI